MIAMLQMIELRPFIEGFVLDAPAPVAMLAQMLILMLGFVLFSAYAMLHSQQVRLGQVSLKELAHDLDLALEAAVRWEVWFDSG